MNETLYNRCREKGIITGHVAEVGVYYPETSNILKFINDGIRATLIEPDPICISKIEEYFKDFALVKILPYAIFDEKGPIKLYRTNASTFVSSLKASPALINDKYMPDEKDSFIADAIRFDDIDDSSIDLLSIDTEGCEWYVIKFMKSRPQVISIETQGKKYTNPFITEILNWMETNGYKIWYRQRSDTVFIKNEIPINFWEMLKYKIKYLFRFG